MNNTYRVDKCSIVPVPTHADESIDIDVDTSAAVVTGELLHASSGAEITVFVYHKK